MNFLNSIQTGNGQQKGQRIVITGVEGVGKTTLACEAPGSLLLPMEDGYTGVKTDRLGRVLETWNDVEGVCKELIVAAKAGRFQRGRSIVWDSVTALERIIHRETLDRDTASNKQKLGKTHSMETAHDGYGKAYPIANAIFDTWLGYNDELAHYGGINVIVTCHIFVVRVVDPSAGEYDTFELLLHSPKNNKTYGKREHLTQWADLIGFLHEPMLVTKDKDAKFSRGIDANRGRILEVERSPAWTAKNRYDLVNAIPIPRECGWNYLADAIFKAKGIDIYNRALLPTKQGA